MRNISIYELTRNPKEQLKQLPVMVTKYNKPYAVISKPGKSIDTSIEKLPDNKKSIDTSIDKSTIAKKNHDKSVDTFKEEKIENLQHVIEAVPMQKNPHCQYPLSVCHTEGHKYEATQYDDSGEVTKDIYLCDKHKAEMQKKGVEISG